jgi:hypothetical protein
MELEYFGYASGIYAETLIEGSKNQSEWRHNVGA